MQAGTATAFAQVREQRESMPCNRVTLNLIHPDPILTAYSHSLPTGLNADASLSQAIRYVLSHPGSLHRAHLASRIAVDYGADHNSATFLATALEYFHTASLIFDDLPCMDDARLRRGAACVHLQFGQHEAILAALALINRAYALSWQAFSELSHSTAAKGMEYLEGRLGVAGLLAGQSADLNYARLPHTAAVTGLVAKGKTVSLIQLSLVWPALLHGASARELSLLERLAHCWGLAYQAADDLKDVLHDASETGKTSGRDVMLDRPNLTVSIGIPATANRLKRLLRIGEANLQLLLRRRPSLGFLEDFRQSLKAEVAALTLSCAETIQEGCA
jgi:geranylgeranyl diphosphate synthase type II